MFLVYDVCMTDRGTSAPEGAQGYRVPEGFSGTLITRFDAWRGAGIGARQREATGDQQDRQRLSLEWRNPSRGVEQPRSGTTSASARSPLTPEGFHQQAPENPIFDASSLSSGSELR